MNKARSVVVIGARIDGQAGMVLDTITEVGGYEVIGFLDNTPDLQGKKVEGIPVLGSSEDLDFIKELNNDYLFHIAIGDNVARGRVFDSLKKLGKEVLTLIHPQAYISRLSKVGEGVFIGPKAVINSGTVLGDVTIINSGAIIEHDNKINKGVHMAPGVTTAGRVIVEDFAFVGVGSTILPDITIGSGALVGAGSTVVKNVPSQTTVIGYAAKKHNKNIYFDSR